MIDGTKTKQAPRRLWLFCCFTFVLLVGCFYSANARTLEVQVETGTATAQHKKKKKKTSKFGDQSLPTLHDDQSYTILIPDHTNDSGIKKSVVVTPMTFVYDYELHDGEMVLTNPKNEHVPNFEFDLAVLAVGSVRNLNRDTGELVSLNEVYFHHFDIGPVAHVSAVTLNRKMETDPFMMFPEGYARYILADEHPNFELNVHLMSNKNLAPINDSIELARKQCVECYYAPNKNVNYCTPERSGTFMCCYSCATTSNNKKRTTTKYRIEIDFLVSRDLESFKHVDEWSFSAPYCYGDSVTENDKLPDGFCFGRNKYGINAAFHHLSQQSNEQPYSKFTANYPSAASGTLVWAQSHLHTGAVNATLYLNGNIICTSTAEHGTNPDPSTNAGNELNQLTYLTSCYDQIPTTGIRFEIRDVFTIESYYYGGTDDPRFSSELVAGEHKGLMSRFFVAVDIDQISPSAFYEKGQGGIINKQPLLGGGK